MIAIHVPGPDEVASIVDSLRKDAAILDLHDPAAATAKRRLANRLASGLTNLTEHNRDAAHQRAAEAQ